MLFKLIGMVLVGALVGYIAGRIYSGSGFGFVKNMIIGIIGSLIGGLLLSLVGFASTGIISSLISDLLGALTLLWIINRIAGKK
ncbi:MAG TPA: GlsB/YeaQ/YmgE family stress response membrane protein [Leptospiraceae bacterium]|nr:GlsB/YeaQ/YmgE family stress response membrane protein [Leptospiraceae bacterium]HMW04145.1 GlsB/YeaQ/YmgE family stress response membrane protein [Leptospiraceae bacterium]HMX30788.1 GlsB/YeaQ/YmgE family stress response membrane protein [Leptospiraceae bacterium]HMY30138.1 GlsB/YeaQ/YmgE family stress response membrane protein [Leptospiraceae bacterium]HMZ64355.1 GlsB/YeaQ/YmgE family stress response membrane protein [Leptospiraceae bacterium]